jgi:hypothetical protein
VVAAAADVSWRTGFYEHARGITAPIMVAVAPAVSAWMAEGIGVRRVALAVHRLHFGVDDPEMMWFNGDRFVETYPLDATSRSSHSYGSTVV